MLLKVEMGVPYTCGGLDNFTFDGTLPYIISVLILIVQIAVPLLLVVFGMLDLGKAVVASKEDEIKKGQQTFIKRLIAGAIVFFVIFIVQALTRFLSNGSDNIMGCFNCFVHGDEEEHACVRFFDE